MYNTNSNHDNKIIINILSNIVHQLNSIKDQTNKIHKAMLTWYWQEGRHQEEHERKEEK